MHSAALPTLRQEKNIFITLRVIVGDLKINLTGNWFKREASTVVK